MFFYFIKIIIIVLCLYGLLNLLNELCVPKVKCNKDCILYVENIENEIEHYLRTVKYLKIDFDKIIIIDLDSTDNTLEILRKWGKNCNKIHILNYSNDILPKNN